MHQFPNKFFSAKYPFCSKYFRASGTLVKILVAVSVMNGLGAFLGFHTMVVLRGFWPQR
jgi:hypothetical protein